MQYSKIHKSSHVAGHQSVSCALSAISPSILQTTRLSVRVSNHDRRALESAAVAIVPVQSTGPQERARAVLAGLQQTQVGFECNIAQPDGSTHT